MNDRYDVVIAGAGPAGAQCARDLAARGYDVVVLETEAEEEFPRQNNKSTAGTFHSMMASFGIPDDVVMQYTDSVVLESPTEHYVRDQTGAVLEFADFKRYLVKDSRDRGASIDSTLASPRRLWRTARSSASPTTATRVYGDITIDATGPSAPLAKKLGVVDLKRENHAIGIEYEFEGIDIDRPGFADLRDAMMLRLDHEIAPGGYSWIFTRARTPPRSASVTSERQPRTVQSRRFHHRRLPLSLARDGPAVPGRRTDRGQTTPRLGAHSGARKLHPIGSWLSATPCRASTRSGEGINKCMQSGRAAAATADSVLKHDSVEPTAETLEVYDTLWHRDVAPNAKSRLLMTQLLYLAPNDRYDKLMQDLQRLDDDTLAEANKGNVRAIADLIELEDAPLLARFAKQQLDFDLRSLI